MLSSDKKLSYYIGAVLIAALLFIRPEQGIDTRYFKDQFLMVSTLISICLFGVKISTKLWHIPLLIIYSFFLIQASKNFHLYYQWTMFMVGMLFMYQLSTKKLDRNIILNSLSMLCIMSSLFVLFEHLNIDIQAYIFKLSGLKRAARIIIENGKIIKVPVSIQGPLGQHTLTAALIGCTIITLFRKYLVFLTPLAVYAIYLCNSAMGVICFLVSTFTFFLAWYPRGIMFLIPLVPGFLYFYDKYPSFFSDTGRFVTWEKIINSMPFDFWGKGMGWFYATSNIKSPYGQVFKHAHCEPLELYIALGVPGLILFALLLSKIRIRDKYIFCVFIGLLINSVFNLTYHISLLSYISIICFTILIGDQYDEQESY